MAWHGDGPPLFPAGDPPAHGTQTTPILTASDVDELSTNVNGLLDDFFRRVVAHDHAAHAFDDGAHATSSLPVYSPPDPTLGLRPAHALAFDEELVRALASTDAEPEQTQPETPAAPDRLLVAASAAAHVPTPARIHTPVPKVAQHPDSTQHPTDNPLAAKYGIAPYMRGNTPAATFFDVAARFDMTRMAAARDMGIAESTLFRTYRRFGITKWPYDDHTKLMAEIAALDGHIEACVGAANALTRASLRSRLDECVKTVVKMRTPSPSSTTTLASASAPIPRKKTKASASASAPIPREKTKASASAPIPREKTKAAASAPTSDKVEPEPEGSTLTMTWAERAKRMLTNHAATGNATGLTAQEISDMIVKTYPDFVRTKTHTKYVLTLTTILNLNINGAWEIDADAAPRTYRIAPPDSASATSKRKRKTSSQRGGAQAQQSRPFKHPRYDGEVDLKVLFNECRSVAGDRDFDKALVLFDKARTRTLNRNDLFSNDGRFVSGGTRQIIMQMMAIWHSVREDSPTLYELQARFIDVGLVLGFGTQRTSGITDAYGDDSESESESDDVASVPVAGPKAPVPVDTVSKAGLQPANWPNYWCDYDNRIRVDGPRGWEFFELPPIHRDVELFALPTNHIAHKDGTNTAKFGIRAIANLRQLTTIGHYAGVLSTERTVRENKYILDSEDGRNKMYDAKDCGNHTRFLNHYEGISPSHNAMYGPAESLDKWPAHVTTRPVVLIKDVKAGEEITIDYGPDFFDSDDEDD